MTQPIPAVLQILYGHTHIYYIGMYINKNRKTLYENVLSCGILKKKAILKGIDLPLWNTNYAFSHTWLSLPIELSKSQGACESVSAHMCRKVGSEKTLYQLANKNGIMGIG